MHIKAKAFTIVELLVVITIVGIIAAISVVAYNGVQRNARDKAIMSDIDAVKSEIVRYSVRPENSGTYDEAINWYSGGAANTNIQFTVSAGNVIDVVTGMNEYCVRGYSTKANKNSIINSFVGESSPGVCVALAPSVAAGGSGLNNLVGWWKLNGSIADSSPSNLNGTFSGTPISVEGKDGASNGAYEFDGGTEYIMMPNASALIAGKGGYSASGWTKPSSNPVGHGGYFGFRNDTTADFYALQYMGTNRLECRYRGSGGAYFTPYGGSGNNITPNTWQFVSIVYDGSNLNCYINGSMVSTSAVTGEITASNVTMYIGRAAMGYYLIGSMDDVRLYDRALSASDVKILYDSNAQ